MCEIHMMRVLPWMVVLEETWETLLASFYFLLSFSVFLPVAITVDRSYAVTRPFDWTSISRHIKNVILTL